MTVELAQHEITELLRGYGEDVNEGQPEQVAGRWIEHGFEDPDEVRALIEAGIARPEDAREQVDSGVWVHHSERHEEPSDHGRDVVRGASTSRSRPGDATESDRSSS